MTNPPQDFRSGGGYPPPGPPSDPSSQQPFSARPGPEQYGSGPPPGQPTGAAPQPGGYPPEPNEPAGRLAGTGPEGPADEGHKLPPAGFDDRGRVRRGRISALWVGLVAAAIVLILLIIFIAQNLDRVTIHFLGFSGSLPVGLVALIAAVIGVLIAAVPGTVRILQLRKALKANTPKDQRVP